MSPFRQESSDSGIEILNESETKMLKDKIEKQRTNIFDLEQKSKAKDETISNLDRDLNLVKTERDKIKYEKIANTTISVVKILN